MAVHKLHHKGENKKGWCSKIEGLNYRYKDIYC